MKKTVLMLALLALAACDSMPEFMRPGGPVDVASLPPLSSEERALLAAGDGAAQTGSYDQAVRNYRDAIARSQGHADAHIALGRFYIKRGEYTKASAVLEEAAEWQPDNADVDYLLGKAYLQQAKPDAALKALTRGLKANPNNAHLLSGTAIANDSKGAHKTAQELHRKSINASTTAEDRAAFQSNLAMSYLLDNQPKQAVDLLEPEMKKPGVSKVLRHNLALAYGLQGRDADAKKLLNGELSETERKAGIVQLKAYIANKKAARPAIHNVN